MAEKTQNACTARRVLITCRTAVDLIPNYLAAGISPTATVRFQSHINGCTDCAAILRTYRKTIELTRSFLNQQDLAFRPLGNSPGRDRWIHSTHPLSGEKRLIQDGSTIDQTPRSPQ